MSGKPVPHAGIQYVAVGASTRAMMDVMARGGRPATGAIDLYQDVDTQAMSAWSIRIRDLEDVPRMAARMTRDTGPAGILLGGGMENVPDAVESIESNPGLRLLGCPAEAIRRARDPELVAHVLSEAGLPWLKVRTGLKDSRIDDGWIAKPLKSAGGDRIYRDRLPRKENPREFWLQEWVRGKCCGATFVGHGEGAELLGCCLHLRSTKGHRYRYEGSAGPVRLPKEVRECLSKMGDCLSRRLGLRGWFGIDFVVSGRRPLVLEINPRFTQSMEILDGRSVASLLAAHLAAIGQAAAREAIPSATTSGRLAGKRILYNDADSDLRISADAHQALWRWNRDDQSVRDVPPASAVIPAGAPICTVWSTADSLPGVGQQLARRAHAVRERLAGRVRG
jgi:predicted ATP-grasp superfamily ATP-dependent carboligase